MKTLVLDTNVVLDLLVFDDPATRPLQAGLEQGQLRWLATAAMREELARVLRYPQIASRMALAGLLAAQVLAQFDRLACVVPAPGRAPVACSDADDQPFIDLAVHHASVLLSKDAAVLALQQRLALLQVETGAALPACSYSLNDA